MATGVGDTDMIAVNITNGESTPDPLNSAEDFYYIRVLPLRNNIWKVGLVIASRHMKQFGPHRDCEVWGYRIDMQKMGGWRLWRWWTPVSLSRAEAFEVGNRILEGVANK